MGATPMQATTGRLIRKRSSGAVSSWPGVVDSSAWGNQPERGQSQLEGDWTVNDIAMRAA
jgi:hypothetical protein